MEENLGIKIKKQRRRIRMDSDDDEPEETGTEDGSRRGRLEGNDDLPDIQVNINSRIFVMDIQNFDQTTFHSEHPMASRLHYKMTSLDTQRKIWH